MAECLITSSVPLRGPTRAEAEAVKAAGDKRSDQEIAAEQVLPRSIKALQTSGRWQATGPGGQHLSQPWNDGRTRAALVLWGPAHTSTTSLISARHDPNPIP